MSLYSGVSFPSDCSNFVVKSISSLEEELQEKIKIAKLNSSRFFIISFY